MTEVNGSLRPQGASAPGCDVMNTVDHGRKLLPTRAQLNAINDVESLEHIRDEVERRIAKIETDLDYRDDTEEWARRAMSALSMHRYTANLIGRRLAQLRKGSGAAFTSLAGGVAKPRERTKCHDLSWALIDGEVPETAGDTLEEIDAAMAALSAAMDALEADKADEVRSFVPTARDEAWLTEAKAALRRARAARHDLSLKRGAILRAEKEARKLAGQQSRERLFVEEAKSFLPKDVFLTIWDRVDRKCLPDALGTSASQTQAGYEPKANEPNNPSNREGV